MTDKDLLSQGTSLEFQGKTKETLSPDAIILNGLRRATATNRLNWTEFGPRKRESAKGVETINTSFQCSANLPFVGTVNFSMEIVEKENRYRRILYETNFSVEFLLTGRLIRLNDNQEIGRQIARTIVDRERKEEWEGDVPGR